MKTTIPPDMIEATRLTRAGQLTEATAILQRLLLQSGKELDTRPGEASAMAGAPASGEPRIREETPEMIEGPGPGRSSATGIQAEAEPSPAGVEGSVKGAKSAIARPSMLDGLRDFIKKLKRTRLTPRDAGGSAAHAPAAAPEVLPKGGRFLTASCTDQAGTRAYKLYVPSAYHGQPLPLIVMLHGCTQSANDFAAGTRMNAVAEEHACFVAYPAQPKSANGLQCWNWFNPGDQQRGRGEPSLIAGITRQIMGDYAIDRRRVYVAGLSAGGAAAAIMGATYPDIYAATGVHSGLARGAASDLPSAFAAMRQGGATVPNQSPRSSGPHGDGPLVPTIVFHGDQDVTVHPRNGDQVIEQLRSTVRADLRPATQRGRAAGGRTFSRTNYLDASGQAVLEMWVVHGAGHAWSGGSPAGSYTDPHGPDASREMVRFFLEHPQTAAQPS